MRLPITFTDGCPTAAHIDTGNLDPGLNREVVRRGRWAPPAVQAAIEQRELQINAQSSIQEDRGRVADGDFKDRGAGW
jgi:hypothetical protein